ncbi:protein Dr1-like isoform X2 [Convolutriloba macropyga]|uniref:protein Dr1-like isoform X2 n=1 Tax=Convolutriloba macropyga TaxID=536237 RepID=UPI003F51ACBF
MSEDSDSGDEGPSEAKFQRMTSQDDDNLISKSSINNIVKAALDNYASENIDQRVPTRISAEAKLSLAYFGSAFIRKVTDAALSHSKKKTMSHEDVAAGLKEFGFDSIAEKCLPIAEQNKASRAANRSRKKQQKLESKGISEEELLKQQEALFEQARKEMELDAAELATYQTEMTNSMQSAVATSAFMSSLPQQTANSHEEEDFDV